MLDHRARSVLRTSQYSAVAEVRFRPCGPGVELAEAVEAVAFGRQTKRGVKSGGATAARGAPSRRSLLHAAISLFFLNVDIPKKWGRGVILGRYASGRRKLNLVTPLERSDRVRALNIQC